MQNMIVFGTIVKCHVWSKNRSFLSEMLVFGDVQILCRTTLKSHGIC